MLTSIEMERRAQSVVDKEILNIQAISGLSDERFGDELPKHLQDKRLEIISEFTAFSLDVQQLAMNPDSLKKET